jgi:benzodiazapine receptor
VSRDLSDWGGNIAAFALVILVNILSGALPINGQSMPEISAMYPSLFTPAGFTFSIWSVIYLALAAFIVYQALPAQRANQDIAGISKPFQINCIANALWIFAWHYNLLAISVLVMLVILVTLILIYKRLLDSAALLRLPFSIYTGWITLATIANVSALQINSGFDDVLLTAINWTLLKLAVSGAIGAIMAIRYRDITFTLVVAWAAYGIYVKQSGTAAVAGAALTLSLLALMLAGVAVWSRVRSSR